MGILTLLGILTVAIAHQVAGPVAEYITDHAQVVYVDYWLTEEEKQAWLKQKQELLDNQNLQEKALRLLVEKERLKLQQQDINLRDKEQKELRSWLDCMQYGSSSEEKKHCGEMVAKLMALHNKQEFKNVPGSES